MNEPDTRSERRKIADEAIANEPQRQLPTIPVAVRPVPVEALLKKLNEGATEAFADADNSTLMAVPKELVPEVQALIGKWEATQSAATIH